MYDFEGFMRMQSSRIQSNIYTHFAAIVMSFSCYRESKCFNVSLVPIYNTKQINGNVPSLCNRHYGQCVVFFICVKGYLFAS